MATIAFEAVFKRYGAVEAVKNLNLTCHQGEMLALLGPSGCGKSSILKMAAGVEDISEGEIRFDGRSIGHLSPGARNIAMVFEDYALYPHLTVEENIAFPLKVRAVKPAVAHKRVNDVVSLLSLEELRHKRVDQLSGGAQQRAAIGRALVRDPELILFDEPLSHLDGNQKVQLRSEISRLQQTAHLTSILVTHDQGEAVAMADRIAVMDHGVLQQVGTPEELYRAPANMFVANFIGEPPMNLLPCDLNPSAGICDIANDSWSLQFPANSFETMQSLPADPRVVIGVRPESVHVFPADNTVSPALSQPVLAVITFFEPRGDTDLLTLTVGASTTVLAEVDGPSSWRVGMTAQIQIAAESAHFFNAESGVALRGRA